MHSSLALLTIFGARAYAWGALGHETVAYIATNLVKNDTKAWAQSILGDSSPGYLANIATWADSYRYTDEGAFSSGFVQSLSATMNAITDLSSFHYIDAEDDPPNSCNVDYERDCSSEEGCIVSAIANYTQRVQEPAELPAKELNYALRWIIHFMGDIVQPLHNEAIAIGGNTINVTFDDAHWNLHALWDTAIPNKIRNITGNVSLADAQAWATDLTQDIESGEYKACAQTWLQGDDIADAKRSALAWARDTNLYVCSSVFPESIEAVSETDLGDSYFDQAAETVQLQIAKGGYRLANWLDQLALAAGQKNATMYRRSAEVDLSGRSLLPAARELSLAKLARRDFGGCDHPH